MCTDPESIQHPAKLGWTCDRQRNAMNDPMRATHAVLVFALVLSAAVAGRAQDAAASAASSADQPQQAEQAAATEQTQPAADQTPERQPGDATAKPAVEEFASGGEGAAEQPQAQPDPAAASGDAGPAAQPANSTRVFTAEQLAELQQQIQQAIDLQRQHKEVCMVEPEDCAAIRNTSQTADGWAAVQHHLLHLPCRSGSH